MKKNYISEKESEAKSGEVIKTLAEKMYRELAYQIINGEIKHGTRLIERELAEKFEISRTPIREALNRLAMDDLVELVPHKGGFVKGLSSKDIIDIYDIRSALEKLALQLSILLIPKNKIKRIKEKINKAKKKSEEDRINDFISIDRDIHKLIVEHSNNERLIKIIKNLWDIVNIYREMDAPLEGRAEEALIEHEDMLSAIERRDTNTACEMLEKHIEKSKNSILKHFKHLLY